MPANSHFKDLLRRFNEAGVSYLVVGGYAVMAYTEPRYTKDLDIWIDPTPGNAALVYASLAAFGAPLAGITAQDFITPDTFYQLGMEPIRIDIMTTVAGIDFADAWNRRTEGEFEGIKTAFLSREDLVTAKRFAGRHSDLADLERLLGDKPGRRRRKPSYRKPS